MGLFAWLISEEPNQEIDRDALAAGVKEIFFRGGMMSYSIVQLLGKRIISHLLSRLLNFCHTHHWSCQSFDSMW